MKNANGGVEVPLVGVGAKLIKFGPDFLVRSDVEKILYLHKLASSLNQALDLMQKERNALQVQLASASQRLTDAQTALDIQKGVVSTLIATDNGEKQGHIKEIQNLRARIKAQDIAIEQLNAEK